MSTPSPGKSPSWLSKLVRSSSQTRSGDEPGNEARARRREQVRKAQRTHRDRKATYVKALEHEVARLRAKDVAHDEEVRQYRELIRRLRDLLASHNIQIPSDLPNVRVDSPAAQIWVIDKPNEPQRIQAHMPTFDASAPFPFERATQKSTQGASSIPDFTQPQGEDTAMQDVSRHPYGLDSSQVGIEFVLALEHPCLYHHQSSNPQLSDLTGLGHQLMVSSPIMRAAPPLSGKGKDTRLPTSSKWAVPAIELHKLLEFSEGLDLDGEITPIQAWQRIRTHPRFSQLTPTQLETLREGLLSVVQCYGFGAVIDEGFFEQMIEQTLGKA